jgi:hypothetical protein
MEDAGPGAAGEDAEQDITSNHEEATVPAMPDVDLLTRLLEAVAGFRLLRKNPVASELSSQLQLHRGGVLHLDKQYRRKRLPGNEHLLVSHVPYKALLEAWRRFIAPDGNFCPHDVLTPEELIVSERGRTAPISSQTAGAQSAGGDAGV